MHIKLIEKLSDSNNTIFIIKVKTILDKAAIEDVFFNFFAVRPIKPAPIHVTPASHLPFEVYRTQKRTKSDPKVRQN